MDIGIVKSIVVRCWQRTVVVTLLLEKEPTTVDETSLLMVVRIMSFGVVKSCPNNVVDKGQQVLMN